MELIHHGDVLSHTPLMTLSVHQVVVQGVIHFSHGAGLTERINELLSSENKTSAVASLIILNGDLSDVLRLKL